MQARREAEAAASDLRLLGLEPSGKRRIAGEVDSFLDRNHRRQRKPVDLEAGSSFPAGRLLIASTSRPLIPLMTGRPRAWATRIPT